MYLLLHFALLMRRGVSPMLPGGGGYGSTEQIAVLLIAAGADMTLQSANGYTALVRARVPVLPATGRRFPGFGGGDRLGDRRLMEELGSELHVLTCHATVPSTAG